MTTYRIGTGIADITDSAIGTALQGMADPAPKVTGVESRLFARAFHANGALEPHELLRAFVRYKHVDEYDPVLFARTYDWMKARELIG